MTWQESVSTVSTAGMLASLPAWLLLAGLFHFGGHGAWRRTALGRNLMTLTLVIVWFHVIALARTAFGDYLGRRELAAVGTLGVAVIGWHRVMLWLDAHRKIDIPEPEQETGNDEP